MKLGVVELTLSGAKERREASQLELQLELQQKIEYQAEIIAHLKTELHAARREMNLARQQIEPH